MLKNAYKVRFEKDKENEDNIVFAFKVASINKLCANISNSKVKQGDSKLDSPVLKRRNNKSNHFIKLF